MANLVIHEFTSLPNVQGEFLWPADRVTRTTGSTHSLNQATRAFVVTTDTNGRMGFDASTGAGDIPLLSSIENSYILTEPASGRTLYFA